MNFSTRLRSVIGDLTIDEFAKSLDEPDHRVKNILRGAQRPPSDFLIKLHQDYGVDLHWLLMGEEGEGAANITAREQRLLANYRGATDEGRKAIEQTSQAVEKRPESARMKKTT
jgi:transcriptional regulator with XRE-family HTH domain